MVRLSVLILKEGGREGIGHSNTVGGRTFKNSDWRNTRDFHRDLLFYFAWYIFENIYACGSCHLCFGKSDSSHLALPTHPPLYPHDHHHMLNLERHWHPVSSRTGVPTSLPNSSVHKVLVMGHFIFMRPSKGLESESHHIFTPSRNAFLLGLETETGKPFYK